MKKQHIRGVYFVQHAVLIHITVVFEVREQIFIYNKQLRYDWFFIGPNRECK